MKSLYFSEKSPPLTIDAFHNNHPLVKILRSRQNVSDLGKSPTQFSWWHSVFFYDHKPETDFYKSYFENYQFPEITKETWA